MVHIMSVCSVLVERSFDRLEHCGCGEGQFKNPCGVAVDGQGNILVTDLEQSPHSEVHIRWPLSSKLLAVRVVEHCSLNTPMTLHTVLATRRCTWLIGIITVSK